VAVSKLHGLDVVGGQFRGTTAANLDALFAAVENRPTAGSPDSGLWAGARIANARGIPGTLGCLALTLGDRRLVLVTTHHVLFGAGAVEHDPVWLVGRTDDEDPFRCVGRSLYGRLGTVRHGDSDVHVDCAAAALEERSVVPPGWRAVDDTTSDITLLAPGDRVTKTGAATGTTHGVVVDTDFSESARVDGRRHQAPGQILVRPLTRGDAFTADGDSGAVLRNQRGAVVGLLWGADARAYGLACPIEPVLRVLHLRLARLVPTGVS
jgi:hypothetical protein